MATTEAGAPQVVELSGELDLAAADQLREKLDRACTGGRPTIVDLRGVTFIDSTGLGVLFTAFERTRAVGQRLVFRQPTQRVQQILRLTGLDNVLPMEGDGRLENGASPG